MLFLIALMSSQALRCPVDLLFRNESTAACVSNESASEKLVGPKGIYADYYLAVGSLCYMENPQHVICEGVSFGCAATENALYENRVLQLFATRECANAVSAMNDSICVAEQMYLPMFHVCRLHSIPPLMLECFKSAG